MKSSPQAQKGSGSGFAWYVRGHASGDGWAVIAFICAHHKYCTKPSSEISTLILLFAKSCIHDDIHSCRLLKASAFIWSCDHIKRKRTLW